MYANAQMTYNKITLVLLLPQTAKVLKTGQCQRQGVEAEESRESLTGNCRLAQARHSM